MRTLMAFGLVVLLVPAVCRAHFLWVVANPQEKPGEVHAYFGETASPDDPELLKKFADLKAAALTPGRDGIKREDIELKQVDDHLAGSLPAGVQGTLVARQTYGVISRGGESFLLCYYAKSYPSVLPGTWQSVADPNDAELTALEITPKLESSEVMLTVTWNGKPVEGDQVTVAGPGLNETIQGDTDADGQFRCKLPTSGLFSIRARHMEKTSGKLGDESYASVRHYATLALPYSAPSLTAVKHSLPELPKGITSFGAAIVGDELYVYGGHFGAAHHYSMSGQSNEFRRLSLVSSNPAWESLPGGPKLSGLAMVSHARKIYRVGGFTVKNGDDEPQNLWSQDGFAVFDPETKTWTDLPALPEPRSSLDAAVLDGKLYIVGGWKMAGPDDTKWHDTAWVCDLNQNELTWTPIAEPPFQRRALSLAAHQGKLYVLGGMQESGGPTTRVDIYDPETNRWSLGPALHGTGMEGFGSSSFHLNGELLATTMSGSVQQLASDGSGWNLAGQLQSPRFFHRQLTTGNGQLLAVGGASMQTGKTNTIELLKPEKE